MKRIDLGLRITRCMHSRKHLMAVLFYYRTVLLGLGVFVDSSSLQAAVRLNMFLHLEGRCIFPTFYYATSFVVFKIWNWMFYNVISYWWLFGLAVVQASISSSIISSEFLRLYWLIRLLSQVCVFIDRNRHTRFMFFFWQHSLSRSFLFLAHDHIQIFPCSSLPLKVWLAFLFSYLALLSFKTSIFKLCFVLYISTIVRPMKIY